ncbi:MAG TPA: glucose-1-phosphate adenylyltransferase, partial [Rhodothermales bacterium]|nr:glucose-1-phosphate adenylyltransferase [Rhodothermales bacterium]
MYDVIAVVLGGGAGTRLHPLTLGRSKPAVPLAGKYRLIDIPISNCINSGVNRIFVLTQYNSASLNRHISTTYQFDRFRGGFVSVLAAEQTAASTDWFQGTADAVRKSLPHLKNHRYEHVLVLAGDQLYLMNYQDMVAYHKMAGADITVATLPVRAEQASAFGILKTGGDRVITEFYEKPQRGDLAGKESPVSPEMEAVGRVYLASMGMYIFSERVLGDILDRNPDQNDFGKQLIPRAIHNRRVVSYPFTGYWSDIGSIRSFFDAHLRLAQKGPEFDLYSPTMPIYSNVRMLPPAKIESSYIQDSLIGEGSIIINSQISNAVIGIRSFVGYNTTIKNAIIMGANYFPWHEPGLRERVDGPMWPGVDEQSYIEGVIVDKNVSIGKRCIITNREGVLEGEREGFFIRDG